VLACLCLCCLILCCFLTSPKRAPTLHLKTHPRLRQSLICSGCHFHDRPGFSFYKHPTVKAKRTIASIQYEVGQYSEVTSRCQKCNSQATGTGGHPSIPEADTVAERPNLVQNGQIRLSSCLKTAFVCILLHLRAGGKAKMPHLRKRIVRRK
jgi:hypothetical protein